MSDKIRDHTKINVKAAQQKQKRHYDERHHVSKASFIFLHPTKTIWNIYLSYLSVMSLITCLGQDIQIFACSYTINGSHAYFLTSEEMKAILNKWLFRRVRPRENIHNIRLFIVLIKRVVFIYPKKVFSEGSWVLKKNMRRDTRQGDKLTYRTTGPFIIEKYVSKGVYILRNPLTDTLLKQKVNGSHLIPFNRGKNLATWHKMLLPHFSISIPFVLDSYCALIFNQ